MPDVSEQQAKAFAAARALRDVVRAVHGNLAAMAAVRPMPATDDDALRQIADELASMTAAMAELRERSAAIAERWIAEHPDRLRPGFGYVISSGREVSRRTT